MIYIEHKNNNTYTVRIQNTNGVSYQSYKLRLKNTVTNEVSDVTFTMLLTYPYYMGTFTKSLTEGEYEYQLFTTIENVEKVLESGLLQYGKFSEGRVVINENNDIVYNG